MKIEDLSLTHLKYFIDTVETSSLSQAAELNYVSRPAISHALTRIETWAGKSLTTHEKGRFKLTQDGQHFFRYAKRAFEDLKKSFETGAVDSGSASIGCSASLIDKFLLPLLPKLNLQAAHIVTGTSSRLKALIESNDINIAISLWDKGVPGFENHTLASGRFVLASKDGSLDSTIVTTEDRPEVHELYNYVLKKHFKSIKYIKVESWTVCTKVAIALNATCLLPDILIQKPLQIVKTPGYRSDYKIILSSKHGEFLSECEAELVKLARLRSLE